MTRCAWIVDVGSEVSIVQEERGVNVDAGCTQWTTVHLSSIFTRPFGALRENPKGLKFIFTCVSFDQRDTIPQAPLQAQALP